MPDPVFDPVFIAAVMIMRIVGTDRTLFGQEKRMEKRLQKR